jgi:isochorismate synthase
LQATLKYRIPGQPIVELHGAFCLLDNPQSFEGFLLSDFQAQKFYGFVEGASEPGFQSPQQPIVISEDAYLNLAHEFIHYLQDLNIGKAILSRVKAIPANHTTQNDLFLQLEVNYPNAFCYSIEHSHIGNWIGATPEILLSVSNGVGATMSLAGTKPVNDKQAWGEKELHEQQLVTDFIQHIIQENCTNVEVSNRGELVAGPVVHLIHRFQFLVNQEKEWDLITSLQPTPAVSGFPRDKALKCIANFEPHEREFYAGIIGLKSEKHTQLYVNLRCGQIIENNLYAFVGGGLTQASEPQKEWVETEKKAETLAKFME